MNRNPLASVISYPTKAEQKRYVSLLRRYPGEGVFEETLLACIEQHCDIKNRGRSMSHSLDLSDQYKGLEVSCAASVVLASYFAVVQKVVKM